MGLKRDIKKVKKLIKKFEDLEKLDWPCGPISFSIQIVQLKQNLAELVNKIGKNAD